jgi:transposase
MVANTIAKYQATGMVKDRKRSGRPKSNKTKEKQRTLEPIEQHQVWMHRALP